MFASTKTLLRAAEALEKVAEIYDAEERQATEKKAAHIRKEYLEPLKESFFEEISPEIEAKLASLDQDVLGLLRRASAHRSSDYTSLGGPDSEKTAGENEDPLLAFCLNDE